MHAGNQSSQTIRTVQKPEALRTLDDLTASGWDEDPGEPYLPGSFVKQAPAELGEDDDLVRWR